MEQDRVTATVGVTRNLGDYNSVRLDFQVERSVRDGQTLEEAAEQAWAFAEKQCEDKLAEYDVD